MSLAGRVSIVTGATGHLGRVITATLAELGSSIAILDKPQTPVFEFATFINSKYGVQAKGYEIDLSDECTVTNAPNLINNSLGCPDILVNNAAFVGTNNLDGWSVPFEKQSLETWKEALDVNLTAVFNLCQASVPFLAQGSHGSIINISSIYGSLGPDWSLYRDTALANPAAYSVSKGGIIQLSRWLATTVAPLVRVNTVSPGGIERAQSEVFQARYVERTPLGRMATEEDFRGVIAFLSSDASSYITGQNIMVDGGWSVW